MDFVRKFFVVVAAVCGCAVGVSGQDVQRFEGELSVGLTAPISKFHGGRTEIGPQFGLEGRYNFPYSAFDCGLLVDVTTAVYGLRGDEQSNRSINLVVNGDYNFRQGEKVNFYAGAGIGLSMNEEVTAHIYPHQGTSFLFRPRIGVELFRHLRIGLNLNVNRVGFSNAAITIGGVIGGRPK